MAYNILAQAVVMALSLIASASSVHIDVQPPHVRPGDENVVFTCAGGNDTNEMLDKIFRMRLMKLDDDDHWMEVGVLRFDGNIDMTGVDATADGRLGDARDSYFVVTWPVAPEDINGRYRCDAIALTSTGDIVSEQSRDLDVTSLSSDVSYLLERLKKTEKRLVGKVNDTMHEAMKTSRINLFSLIDSNFDALKEYLDNKTTVRIGTTEEEREIMNWPEGEFTLLMPSAGCPLHPPAWIKGFKRMEADLDDNKYYPLDVPLHLANPHKKDGYIYRQFCTLPASPESTKPWPEGSYCLYTMSTSSCPPGFKSSEVKVKILKEKGNFYLYYYAKKDRKSGSFTVSASRFCCRHDGIASSPIDLPVSHPFYLFSHGGRCQEVKGMDVTQDVFMMETVEDVDYDKWTDSNPDFHPDVSFQPYKEDLCYYSRSKV